MSLITRGMGGNTGLLITTRGLGAGYGVIAPLVADICVHAELSADVEDVTAHSVMVCNQQMDFDLSCQQVTIDVSQSNVTAEVQDGH